VRALLRFLSRAPGGALATRERTFDGEALTLGRATDQALQFKDRRVAFQHARIVRRGDRTVLSCRPPATIAVNDTLVRDAELAVGDVLRLGANVLTIVPPPAGFDLALTFELEAQASEEDLAAGGTSLRLAVPGLGKRSASWLLFAAILAGFLVVPLLALPVKSTRDALRASWLPSDRAWSSGAVHAAHRTIEGRCEVCHEQPFVRVRNDACLACHGPGLRRHVALTGPAVPALETARCESCHAGHEPSALTRHDERLCTNCHANLRAVTVGRIEALDAADFATAHPEFRVTMLRAAAADGGVRTERVRLDAAGLREESHLKFPHAKHLNPKGVKTTDGQKVLGCADCHRPEPGGARMQPIVMERDCEGCHRLDFDPAFPERQLPHGDAAAVLNTLLEYYSARYLEGWPDPNARTRPDRFAATAGPALAPAERERRLGLARARTQIVARDLFERRACQVCHEVRATPGGTTPWTVTPVRLTHEWFPAARFDHARHGTALTDCAACHAAQRSAPSAAVLMPRSETCRHCHAGGTGARPGQVATGCPVCHAFHDARHESWAPRARAGSIAR
jgi:predicted CXXCH cytochrome family protein